MCTLGPAYLDQVAAGSADERHSVFLDDGHGDSRHVGAGGEGQQSLACDGVRPADRLIHLRLSAVVIRDDRLLSDRNKLCRRRQDHNNKINTMERSKHVLAISLRMCAVRLHINPLALSP